MPALGDSTSLMASLPITEGSTTIARIELIYLSSFSNLASERNWGAVALRMLLFAPVMTATFPSSLSSNILVLVCDFDIS